VSLKPIGILNLLGFLCMSLIMHAGEGGDLHFIANKGQWDNKALYKAELQGGQVFFTDHGFRYSFYSAEDMQTAHDHLNDSGWTNTISWHAYDVIFEGSRQPVVSGFDKRSAYHNYFIGNDESKWAGNVPLFSTVHYAGLYDDIDMNVYSRGTSLKYDFVVQPGGDPADIALSFDGVTPVLNERGELVINTSVNTVIEQAPYAYQLVNGEQVPVACAYRLKDGKISFYLPGGYDRSIDLVIDPVLVFATYTGSTGDLWAYCSTFDANGNFYSASEAYATGFPVTTGAFQTNYVSHDLAINKYNSAGDSLLFSTYCGGVLQEHPTAMTTNHNNELVIAGQTYSSDYPVTSGAYDKTFNADSVRSDIFVTVFSADGTSLIGSTFVGGTGMDGVAAYAVHDNDQNKSGICVDVYNNIYVASTTLSKDFPVSLSAFQKTPGSSYNGCVFKLSSNCSGLLYSTYLGGNHQDCIYDCKLAGNGELAVCGRTISSNFPLSTNAYSNQGNAFVTILNNTGSAIVASTKLGQYSSSAIKISLDDNGKVFVCGNNDSGFAIKGAGFYQQDGRIFVAKLTPGLDTMIRSTKLVNTSRPGVTGFVNICGDILGSLYVKDSSNLPLTPNAYQADYSVYYFFHIDPSMDSLIYSTYFGVPFDRNGHAHGSSAIDTSGVIWLSTCNQVSKHLLPGTSGSYCPTSKSRQYLDNDHLSVKFDMEVLAVKPVASIVRQDTACLHTDIYFNNLSKSSYSYLWDFGDGDTSHAKHPIHQYDTSGTFVITLSAFNPHSCKVVDVLKDTIYIDSIVIESEFKVADTVCVFTPVSMMNTSVNALSYYWDFGDGNTATTVNGQHTYTTGGTYKVMLVGYNPSLCNATDTIYHYVTVDTSNPGASFTVDKNTVCVDMPVQFQNNSLRGISYEWDFDDGNGTTVKDPAHSYTQWGVQDVRLVATNLALCVPHDTAYVPVNVREPLRIELADSFICGDSVVDWSVKVINANSFVTYKWEPANAILSATDVQFVKVDPKVTTKYFVTVNDSIPGLCSHTRKDTGNLVIVPYPTGVYASVNSPLCERDTLRLEAGSSSGLGGLLYKWTGPKGYLESGKAATRTSLTREHTGVYTVGVDNHGCVTYKDIDVLVKPVPFVKATSNSPVFAGYPLQFDMTSDLAPDSVLWEGPRGYLSKEMSPVIDPAMPEDAGPYTLAVMVDGCLGGAVTTVSVDVPDSQYVHLYPNPNNGTFFIEGKGHNEQEVDMIIINSIGQRIYRAEVITENKHFKHKVVLSAASGGVYIVYMLMDGKYWSLPFTIRRE